MTMSSRVSVYKAASIFKNNYEQPCVGKITMSDRVLVKRNIQVLTYSSRIHTHKSSGMHKNIEITYECIPACKYQNYMRVYTSINIHRK